MNEKDPVQDFGMTCWNCGKKTKNIICEHCGANQLKKPTNDNVDKNHVNGVNHDNEEIVTLRDTHVLVVKDDPNHPKKIPVSSLKEIVEKEFPIKRVLIKKQPIFLISLFNESNNMTQLNEKLANITNEIHKLCDLLYPRIIPKKQKTIFARLKDEEPREKEAYMVFQQLKEASSNLKLAWVSFIVSFLSILVTGYLLGRFYDQTLNESNQNMLYDKWVSLMIFAGGLIFLLAFRIYMYYSISHDLQLYISKPLIIPSVPFFNVGVLGILADPVKPTKERDGVLLLYLFSPLISLFLSIIIFIIGVFMSIPGETSLLLTNVYHGELPFLAQIIILLMVKLKLIDTASIILSPIAYVGFVGMIINGLALLPVPMLDGGKMFRNWLSSSELIIISIIFILYLLLQQEWVLAVFLLLMTQSSDEIRPLNEIAQTSPWLKYLVFISFLLAIVCVFPPLQGTLI